MNDLVAAHGAREGLWLEQVNHALNEGAATCKFCLTLSDPHLSDVVRPSFEANRFKNRGRVRAAYKTLIRSERKSKFKIAGGRHARGVKYKLNIE